MTTALTVLNFGEPAEPDREVVVEYLTRIFYNNASLEDAETEEEALARSRQLAERRAPGLLEEYEEIGGSPLNEQATAQADAIGRALRSRGYEVATYHGMQFLDPLIEDLPELMRDDGIEHVIGLPIYPLCGPSTTVAALDDLETAIEETEGFDPEFTAITGWHRHPSYTRLRAEGIASFAEEQGLDLTDPETSLLFSAHGTPLRYVEEGSRYVKYVQEHCETLAAILGVSDYALGYQNHSNRGVPWTEPDVEDAVVELDAERVVVEPVSFLHEQSETLSELDIDLKADAEEADLEFHRVPVPHDDERIASLLADLAEPFLAGFDPGYHQLRQCQCRDSPGTMCLNAERVP